MMIQPIVEGQGEVDAAQGKGKVAPRWSDFPHIAPSISGGEVGGAHLEERDDLLLEGIELRLEGLDPAVTVPELVSLQCGEDLEDAFGTGRATLALLRVERQVVESGGGHRLSELTLEQRLDQQRQEVEEEEGFDPRRALQPDFPRVTSRISCAGSGRFL
jgi:hypothetical protein